MKIDSINWKILDCLQNNARQTNTHIANVVGISSPAVAERIKKMEDAGIILSFRAKDISFCRRISAKGFGNR
jgi:Lrp/AsnC family leucine-responsive transcriptional regulator